MRSYRAVSGHFSLSTLLQIAPASAIGTILREPRARLLSLYSYWRTPNVFDAWLPYSLEEHALKPLDRFMAEPRVAAAVDNQVCRMLLGDDPRIPSDSFIAGHDIEAIASDAISQLDTLGFVGVLELGDTARQGLAQLFGVSLEPRMLNVTGKWSNPAAVRPQEQLAVTDTLDLIEQRNKADRILYDHALALAGIGDRERQRLAQTTFVDQLVRLGDLLGSSAAELAQQARGIDEPHMNPSPRSGSSLWSRRRHWFHSPKREARRLDKKTVQDRGMSDLSELERRRIALTVAVRDTDAIPKVPDAGEIVTHHGESVQVMHNGVMVREGCYHGPWMTEVIRRLRGHHEPQEELAFHTVLRRLASDTRAPTMVELGSFWAYYSLWAKRAIPATRLVLVEPDLANLAVGRHNLELNDMDAAFVINAAIGNEHDIAVTLAWESDGQPHPTRLVTIDGLMHDLDLQRIDLLLCDIQGAEVAALEGAARALADRRVRFLVISTHHHRITGDPLTHQRCLRLLQEVGVHFIAEHSASESCSGDGLIVASTDPSDADLRADVSIVRARDTLFGELEWDLAEARDGPEPLSPPPH